MNSLTFRIATAVLTFVIGVGVATAWVLKRGQPRIEPVELGASSATLEMVFVLDTTGSMGGLLEGAKQRIWGIVNEVMQSTSKPSVRIGLVAYRDRGDQYVTQVLPLTDDLDKVYTTLMDYQAAGGGDAPEDVRRALADGVARAGWSRSSQQLAQIIFLVGDAPPHNDYIDEQDTLITASVAVQQGMVVNTIQCGTSNETKQVWESIAQHGKGQYFAIPQNGGVQTIATPYDEQLSQLGTKLGSTYVAYGGGAGADGERYRDDAKVMADRLESSVAASAPAEAKAERSINKAINSQAYIGDLLQNIENGTTKLESVKDEDLPSDLQKLSVDERKKEVEKRLEERRQIRAQIMALSKQRTDYIQAEQKKRTGGARNGFDSAVSTALKEQLARKGIK
ncbi:MAG TPA: vWA domain-containing protein [Pyrinomonadaceae bacterium]|jgi:Mg-chelatase subunit ChlD|nr:vWA domain-containing protein [Pyrinomonadaceae bacterium]